MVLKHNISGERAPAACSGCTATTCLLTALVLEGEIVRPAYLFLLLIEMQGLRGVAWGHITIIASFSPKQISGTEQEVHIASSEFAWFESQKH